MGKRKYRNLVDVNNLVENALISIPYTRGSDRLLYLEILKKVGVDTHATSIFDVMTNDDVSFYPSVSRARRKVQELHPELRPTSDIQAYRELEEERYKKYAASRMD